MGFGSAAEMEDNGFPMPVVVRLATWAGSRMQIERDLYSAQDLHSSTQIMLAQD